jgi:hypothetical protein
MVALLLDIEVVLMGIEKLPVAVGPAAVPNKGNDARLSPAIRFAADETSRTSRVSAFAAFAAVALRVNVALVPTGIARVSIVKKY